MSIKAEVTGNLTGNPTRKDVRVGNEMRPVVEFRVFSDEYKKVGDAMVQDDDKCTGIDVSIWADRLGEQVVTHLRKGWRVRVKGDMHLHRYNDEHGVEKSGLRMVAESCDLVLSSRIESVTYKPSRAEREAEQGAGVPA